MAWEQARLNTKQGNWLPTNIRSLFLACRPWSLPSSFAPCICIYLFILYFQPASNIKFYNFNYVVSTFYITFVHLLGNLINTVKDFEQGVDTKKYSADRALVDKTVTAL